MFWTLAISMLIVAGLLTAWPLLSSGSNWKAIGLAVLVAIPLGGAILYQEVGTPLAMNPSHQAAAGAEAGDLNSATDNLRANLQEREEDLDGWLLLGRSLKSLQRFNEALEALETAGRIAPDNPLVRVELAEAMLFASGNPQFTPEIRQMLRTAVAMDPTLQKGLWLLGIDAAQQGEDLAAIDYWEDLLGLVEPESQIAASVQDQISQAQQRLGMTPAEPEPVASSEPGEWPGVNLQVALGPEASRALGSTGLPSSAVLFVIARPGGMNAGPPLGVARIGQPQFPIELTLDDNNAMIAENLLSGQEELQITARLSLSGGVVTSAGDWSSEPISVSTGDSGPHSLELTNLAE